MTKGNDVRGEPPIDDVQEASEESFPASDPPSVWAGPDEPPTDVPEPDLDR